jgi:hypothetical protein
VARRGRKKDFSAEAVSKMVSHIPGAALGSAHEGVANDAERNRRSEPVALLL